MGTMSPQSLSVVDVDGTDETWFKVPTIEHGDVWIKPENEIVNRQSKKNADGTPTTIIIGERYVHDYPNDKSATQNTLDSSIVEVYSEAVGEWQEKYEKWYEIATTQSNKWILKTLLIKKTAYKGCFCFQKTEKYAYFECYNMDR